MKKYLALLLLLALSAAHATDPTSGQIVIQKKNSGAGYSLLGTAATVSSLLALDGSGNFTTFPETSFISSITNDGTLNLTPSAGAIEIDLNLARSNVWTGPQTISPSVSNNTAALSITRNLTGSSTASFLSLTGGLNIGSQVVKGILLNYTSTTMGAASKLMDLQTHSSSQFAIDFGGDIWIKGAQFTNGGQIDLTAGVANVLPVVNGGTGTATPGLVAGTNITLSGTFPNQTINASGGLGGSTGAVDRAILVADGTGGATMQAGSTGVTISSTDVLSLKSPANLGQSWLNLYNLDGGTLNYILGVWNGSGPVTTSYISNYSTYMTWGDASGRGIVFGAGSSLSSVEILGPADNYGVIFRGEIKIAGIVGVTDGSDATAGNVGEYAHSELAAGSALSLSTGTTTNITSLSLQPGDWDIEGNVNFVVNGAAATSVAGGFSSSSATLPTDGTEVYSGAGAALTNDSVTLPRRRFSLSTSTVIYMVGLPVFTGGSVAGFGSMTARRVR